MAKSFIQHTFIEHVLWNSVETAVSKRGEHACPPRAHYDLADMPVSSSVASQVQVSTPSLNGYGMLGTFLKLSLPKCPHL